jgi:hypothetical protein
MLARRLEYFEEWHRGWIVAIRLTEGFALSVLRTDISNFETIPSLNTLVGTTIVT